MHVGLAQRNYSTNNGILLSPPFSKLGTLCWIACFVSNTTYNTCKLVLQVCSPMVGYAIPYCISGTSTMGDCTVAFTVLYSAVLDNNIIGNIAHWGTFHPLYQFSYWYFAVQCWLSVPAVDDF